MRILNRVLFLPRKQLAFQQLNTVARSHRLPLPASPEPKNTNIFVLLRRPYSTSKKPENKLVENVSGEQKAVQTTVIENIKETTKTVSYLGFVLVGFSIGLSVIFAICYELFSGKSPNKIYSKAFDYVSKDSRIQNVIGDQIKGFGEETRRGRRRHIAHVSYQKDGMNLLRMKFYIKGNRESGTVHLEMFENEKGKYEYRYLFVVTDGVNPKSIILEDNRYKASATAQGNAVAFPALSTDLPELDLSSK
ncbi:mitochondrial import inner membrane translocase subunit Tim21 [Planococcus citri]|uniref:mitochondrial import inner membrane translocase subunit Tim21 n=1 Tax=Planococcus citri TaxID=170843 RepID=UPI0031FA367D